MGGRSARGSTAEARSSSATVAKSRPPRPPAEAVADDVEVGPRLRHRHAEPVGERGDQPQVLGREVERERDGRARRVEERRPLVADVRRTDRARGDDVVGELARSMPARLGEDEPLRERRR